MYTVALLLFALCGVWGVRSGRTNRLLPIGESELRPCNMLGGSLVIATSCKIRECCIRAIWARLKRYGRTACWSRYFAYLVPSFATEASLPTPNTRASTKRPTLSTPEVLTTKKELWAQITPI